MPTGETIAELAKRCNLPVRRDTPAQRALAEAGWLPYLHVDREIVQRDVEIVGGMAEADGMCRPDGIQCLRLRRRTACRHIVAID